MNVTRAYRRNFIIILLTVVSVISLHAQQQLIEIGSWDMYPVFSSPPQKVINTGDIIYFQSGGSLFSYNEKEDETICYTRLNKLTGYEVTNIFYNYDSKYLVIAYSNGNIDVLYNNGRIVNMSDILDSVLSGTISINDVAFDGDMMYMATSFGVVQFNMSRHEVVQSGVWNTNVSGIEVMDGKVVLLVDEKGLMSFPTDKHIATMQSLDFVTDAYPVMELFKFDNQYLLARLKATSGKTGLRRFTIDTNTMTCTRSDVLNNNYINQPLIRDKDNTVYFRASANVFTLNEKCDPVPYMKLPEDMVSELTDFYKGRNKVWTLNNEGLACYGFDESGNPTLYNDRIRPADACTRKVHYLLPASDGRHLYAFSVGPSRFKFGLPVGDQGYNSLFAADLIDMNTGGIKGIAPYPVEASNPFFKGLQNRNGKYILGVTSVADDPDNENSFYVATNGDGLYKITDGKVSGYYSPDNSPLQTIDSRWIVYGVSVDRGGNLWIVTNSNGGLNPTVMILPSDKRRLPSSQITADDWIIPDVPSSFGHMDFRILHCTKSNMIFILDTSPNNILLAYDTKGTFNDFSDDECRVWSSFVDQDGRVYEATEQYALAEDKNGKVWLGTNKGVVEITNPSNAINSSMRINHLKVPRNDGTNSADYLLGSSMVTDISVDAANRKWISTAESGLYLVSPAGDAIMAHYGVDNSMLPSDYVNSLYADPNSNFLYVGTDYGLMRLSTNTTPPQENFDEIYAFPNPVRPEHFGPVYIKGLMDNTLVKITDATGNIVNQGRSEGGLYTWDACDRTGRRVRTGVYYVFVSQSTDDSSHGAVTKIMVVN